MQYSISIIQFSDLQHTVYRPNDEWVRTPVGPPISMRRAILFYFTFLGASTLQKEGPSNPPKISRPSHSPIFLRSCQLWNLSQKPYFGGFVQHLHSFMNVWFYGFNLLTEALVTFQLYFVRAFCFPSKN